jgi:hypothetical protein
MLGHVIWPTVPPHTSALVVLKASFTAKSNRSRPVAEETPVPLRSTGPTLGPKTRTSPCDNHMRILPTDDRQTDSLERHHISTHTTTTIHDSTLRFYCIYLLRHHFSAVCSAFSRFSFRIPMIALCILAHAPELPRRRVTMCTFPSGHKMAAAFIVLERKSYRDWKFSGKRDNEHLLVSAPSSFKDH